MTPAQIVAMLRAAQASALGLYVETPSPTTLRGQIYKARKDNPEFSNLTVRIPSWPNTLFIVKKESQS